MALAGGSYIFLGVVILILLGVVWGYYTRSGNDITLRPSDGQGRGGEGAAPGAKGPDRITGTEDGEPRPLDTFGTG